MLRIVYADDYGYLTHLWCIFLELYKSSVFCTYISYEINHTAICIN